MDSSNTDLYIIKGELESIDRLHARTAIEVFRALTYVLDGAEHFDDLEAVEKTIIGTKIEKYWLREFGFPTKISSTKIKRMEQENPGTSLSCPLLDTEICNIPVDIKHTVSDNWMVPPEGIGHWLILFRTEIDTNTYSMGLFKATPENLTKGCNQDKKKSISKAGKKTITWLIENHTLENIDYAFAD